MIINTNSEAEYDQVLRHLIVINMMRSPRVPIIEDTPWVKTCWAKPEYL